MVADVVVVQRLFDHRQVEPIELGQPRRVRERVGGVGVDHQRNVTELGAHPFDRLHIPPRLDLDFDTAIAGSAFDRDALDELVERILYPDRDPGVDRCPVLAAEQRRQADPSLASGEVPGGHLDGRLGHLVAADDGEGAEDLARMVE